jgi:thioredoxin 2
MNPRLVVCCGCNAVNRVPSDRPAAGAKCGKCGTKLFGGKPCDVTTRDLEVQIGKSGIPILVDVWAPWCGPCRMMAPAFEAAARELEPDFRLLKLNSDQEPEASGRLGVRGIPTMILFKDAGELGRVSGAMSAGQIIDWARARVGVGGARA